MYMLINEITKLKLVLMDMTLFLQDGISNTGFGGKEGEMNLF